MVDKKADMQEVELFEPANIYMNVIFKSFLSVVAAVTESQGSVSHLKSIFAMVTDGISLDACMTFSTASSITVTPGLQLSTSSGAGNKKVPGTMTQELVGSCLDFSTHWYHRDTSSHPLV